MYDLSFFFLNPLVSCSYCLRQRA